MMVCIITNGVYPEYFDITSIINFRAQTTLYVSHNIVIIIAHIFSSKNFNNNEIFAITVID